MATTWFEQGIEQGIEKGRQLGVEEGLRQGLIVTLEERFGRLPAKIKKAIKNLSADELGRLFRRAVTAESLSQIKFDD